MMRRRSLHQIVFTIAGFYNIAWGVCCIIDPAWMLRVTGSSADNSELVAALGLVIGLYGVLYLEVARSPERGSLIAAVGLVGKVLGPVGVARAVLFGGWPPSTFLVSLTNDFIWWIPFVVYLHDAWPSGLAHRVPQSNESIGSA